MSRGGKYALVGAFGLVGAMFFCLAPQPYSGIALALISGYTGYLYGGMTTLKWIERQLNDPARRDHDKESCHCYETRDE